MHLALIKKLIAEISNTKKLSTTTTCADDANYYDRVAHPYDILCAQCFGKDLSNLVVLFITTHNAKMHLNTSFGV